MKPEEVWSQRSYKVLLSNNKKVSVLAQDDYEGLQHKSADDNPFYKTVIAAWRKGHATPHLDQLGETL
jgi:hypothetical protein